MENDDTLYCTVVIPHITLHGCLLENTTKVLKELNDVVWKPEYTANLITKKRAKIEKLELKGIVL